jgi:hypothetical protein
MAQFLSILFNMQYYSPTSLPYKYSQTLTQTSHFIHVYRLTNTHILPPHIFVWHNNNKCIILFLFFSVTNLPEKIAIYSTLVGLLNARNYKCGEEVS